MPITHEDLKRCASLARETEKLREQVLRLQAKSERTSACAVSIGRCGGRVGDPVGTAVANLDELQEKWARAIKEFSELAGRVDAAIAEVEDPDQRTVLRLRYIDGRQWDDIGAITHYTPRWAKELRRRGIRAMQLHAA